jgi:S1-C subfamily serine protease
VSTITAVTAAKGPPDTAPGAAGALQDTFVGVLAQVRPSVVEVSTTDGLGSGVVYDTKGDVVTNAHVVGTATTFKVSLLDGRTLDGTLVGASAPDDLAVIRCRTEASRRRRSPTRPACRSGKSSSPSATRSGWRAR